MVTQRSRTIRILVLLSLLIGALNELSLPVLFANAAPPARAAAEFGNDLDKPDLTRPDANASRDARLAETHGNLPMSFEANEGQFDSRVKFASRGRGYALFLTANEAVIALSRPAGNDSSSDNRERMSPSSLQPFDTLRAIVRSQSPGESAHHLEPSQSVKPHSVLRIKLVGGRRSPRAERMEELPGKSNYFIGNDPEKWRTNISNYAKVRYRSVYRGIDLVYYGDQGSLEYDFNVAPGANPRAIRLCFDGGDRLRIDENGDLVFSTSVGEVRQRKPVVYQEINGRRRSIAARYSMSGKNEVYREAAGDRSGLELFHLPGWNRRRYR
ncbi:MAG: hypothetical protein AABO41_17865 [Acidobacteriota bacterium]